MHQTRVLILCTGNSCRSQMAEGLMRASAARKGMDIEIESAGIRPHVVDPHAIESLADIGIDISNHRSKSVMLFVGQRFDYVITVCDAAAEMCPVFPGHTQRLHWPTEDPAHTVGDAAAVRAAFARIRDELAARIERWLAETFDHPTVHPGP
ncbi:MAG: arsenate reductase ArsC [Phycisphaerae bacterium]|nr:arsenate reductase ArsC [Phycisphaerae bacterium]